MPLDFTQINRTVEVPTNLNFKPVFEPSRVNKVLSTTVEPCTKKRQDIKRFSSLRLPFSAAALIELIIPSAKFGGVDNAFPTNIGSPDATITVSVQVPPTSVAIIYLSLIIFSKSKLSIGLHYKVLEIYFFKQLINKLMRSFFPSKPIPGNSCNLTSSPSTTAPS